MKRFRSRFESLHRLRAQQEKMASLAMMQAIANENACSLEHKRRQAEHENAVGDVATMLHDRLLSVSLTAARTCVLTAEQTATNAHVTLQQAKDELASVTEERMQAYQRLQSVSKAADREAAAYRKAIQDQALVNRIDNIRIQTPPTVDRNSSRADRRQKDQS